MPTVAIFADASFEASCRAVALARAVAAAGHRPVVVGEARWLESSVLVGRAELPLVHTEPRPIPALLEGRGDLSVDFAVAGAVAADIEALRAIGAERVVSVSWPPALIAAALCDVPSISVVEAGRIAPLFELEPLAALEAEILGGEARPHTPGEYDLPPSLDPTVISLDPLPHPMERFRRVVPRAVNAFLEAQKLAPRRWVDELYHGELATLLTGLVAPAASLPPGAVWCGPVAADLAAVPPRAWDALGDRPAAYVELDPAAEPLLARVCSALAGAGLTPVVASRGESVDAGRGLVVRHLPHALAVERAAVVVCNGQSALVARALDAGTPVVALPDTMHRAVECVHASRETALRVLPRGAVEMGTVPFADVVAAELASERPRPAPLPATAAAALAAHLA